MLWVCFCKQRYILKPVNGRSTRSDKLHQYATTLQFLIPGVGAPYQFCPCNIDQGSRRQVRSDCSCRLCRVCAMRSDQLLLYSRPMTRGSVSSNWPPAAAGALPAASCCSEARP